jgi:hypothetical protein
MDNVCRRRVVAQGPACSIEECACGVVHLTVGVFTIRLQAEVVASIWETLGVALERLATQGEARARARRGFPRPKAERPS